VKIVQSLETAFMLHLGEKFQHPVFGYMEIVFLSSVSESEVEVLCKLLEFNNTLKTFDALTLSRIKFKASGLRSVE